MMEKDKLYTALVPKGAVDGTNDLLEKHKRLHTEAIQALTQLRDDISPPVDLVEEARIKRRARILSQGHGFDDFEGPLVE